MPLIETERLVLRELTAADTGFVLELLNESDFIRYIGDRGVRTLEDAARWIEAGPRANYTRLGFGHYAIELKSGGEAVGICGFRTRDGLDIPDLGYALLARYRASGYATEAARAALQYAARTLRLPRVAAICAPDNLASQAVLEKLGFAYDRTVRLPGEDHDVLVYVTNI